MKTDKLLQYIHNLDKLLEQHENWSLKRIEFMIGKNLNRADYIQTIYLKPLKEKISKMASIILEEMKHE